MSTNNVCGICIEEYDTIQKLKTVCVHCQFDCCLECNKRYILQLHNDPTCMSCNRIYEREHLCNIYTKSFIKTEYRLRREDILLKKETILLPITQRELQREKKVKEIRVQIQELNLQKTDTLYTILKLRRKEVIDKVEQEELEKLISKKKHLHQEIKVLKDKKTELSKPLDLSKHQTRKCCVSNCIGYLEDDWKCGVCDTVTCHECWTCVLDGHICKQDDLNTVKEISENSKCCPACSTLISKIDGCNQIWCPACHNAFDWHTLELEKGQIHNPHFYEHQRNLYGGNMPRLIHLSEIPILPTMREVLEIWQENDYLESLSNLVYSYIRLSNMQTYIRKLPNEFSQPNNMSLRKSFLDGKLNELSFKRALYRREKAHKKAIENRRIMIVLLTMGYDIIDRSLNGEEDENVIVTDLTKLLEYGERCFKLVGYFYDSQSYDL
jgi:hypothetical protein